MMGRQDAGWASFRRRVATTILFVVCFAAAAVHTEASHLMDGPQDEWHRLQILEHHVGWLHTVAERSVYEGAPAWRVRAEFMMRLLRSGTPIELHRVRVVHFGAETPFAPYAFTMTSNESGEERRVEGRVNDGAMRMTTHIAGRSREHEVDLPAGTLFEEAVGYYVHERLADVGNTHSTHVFNGDMLLPMLDAITIDRVEEITLPRGDTAQTTVVEHTLDWMDGVRMTEWYDASGQLVATEMDALGVPMRVLRTSREDATGMGEASDLDVILATKLTVQGPSPTDPTHFAARARLSEGDIAAALLPTQRQQVGRDDDGWVQLDVRRDPRPDSPAPFPPPPSAHDSLLTPTVYVEADDAAIVAQAGEITEQAENSWQAVDSISRWVYAYITDKTLDKGFATARQTLDSRIGDCTEHTMLAVALTRAAGIPARILAGVVWQRDAFYYHFWYEAFVGEWVAMDPTLGQSPADARRIQLSGGALESDTALEFGEGILRTLNRLELVTGQ
ncbi:transglutaminase domain-containing protein [Candidatus Poribacteria bacterium]|jgi:hypothetical protein|nr:transglutaminase domain-containing protein [Candidatus Poribacteria bacterium]MBT5531978.1 transglutaminase domain-containing protein [Candidatus Poribacteria bacterium]MBT5710725.1 transglutaminase domain-containing protein [Candidatus Poribacteria bacterium]MBT7097030.1 transglutaminase domain-containing protein [Candidatus Poribacteria bacterium]MBT7809271.1 transglutaminase domain-containing protein [Candidatus Poribacteria bacterium]